FAKVVADGRDLVVEFSQAVLIGHEDSPWSGFAVLHCGRHHSADDSAVSPAGVSGIRPACAMPAT
ncbi:MAG TPA: hypothetical protein VN899_04990, partial [Stellaceae bacterium]|nr:hypothetical protein [Stellaceae bacterium]